MFLGIIDILQGMLTPSEIWKEEETFTNQRYVNHDYIRGNVADRGPCPGLNALANHGYIKRDGRNITLPQVKEALMTALHMDKTLASSITRPLRPLRRKDDTFDLVDMRRHNVIEHDASFTRLDFRQGDNYTFQPAMFQAMLEDANGGPVTIESLARTYVRRHKEKRASGGPLLPLNLWFVNLLQTVSLMNTAQTGGKLSKEVMKAFYEEERFPKVILENQKTRTLAGLIGYALALLFCIIFRVW